ncbi:citrate/2-methylcitrate synthase [Phenylobacterium sp.]|uniref:citrate/2-methylcitrate synthase n=1 Tax=Phenylobacterium sp. TaxID=1871053 RepID=UPI0035B01053
MSNQLYISAEEAAARLGVALPTLYAYVGRKNIRSQKVPGSRKRRYWLPDVERAAQRANRVASGGLTSTTDITLLTPEGPYFRGQSAIDLADHATLEDVAALLWEVEVGEAFEPRFAGAPNLWARLRDDLAGEMTTDTAIAMLPFLEHANPRAFDLTRLGMARSGGEIMRWYAAILTGAQAISAEPLHLQVAARFGRSADAADLIRRLLVLSADHGFGAGTHAVRAVASTGVSPYRAVLAGLAIVTGRRSLFGRSDGISRLIAELIEAPDPRGIIIRRLHEGELIPGFQSPAPYAGRDPRALHLLAAYERVRGDEIGFRRVKAAIDLMSETFDAHPGFAFVNGLVARGLGFGRQHVLYVLGRCAGWTAHAIEQYEAGEIDGLQTTYLGALPPTSR